MGACAALAVVLAPPMLARSAACAACGAPAPASDSGARPTSGEPLREIFARRNVFGGVAVEEESGGEVGGEGDGGLLAAFMTIS